MLTLLPSLARRIVAFLSYESCYTCARSYVTYFGEVVYRSLLRRDVSCSKPKLLLH